MTQIIRMSRSAWIYHFKKARSAGNRSRAEAEKAATRKVAETARAAAAPPELRKAAASFQISKGGEHNLPANPKNVTPRRRRW